jgi:hypothetical protein
MPQSPEDFWPIDDECRESFNRMTALGRSVAKSISVAVVSIARNAMPVLANTLELVDELRRGFGGMKYYVLENDSADGTAECLDAFAATRPWAIMEHDTLGGIDSRGFERERTERLASCRNRCHDWVSKNATEARYVIVLDVDPVGGFSVDGVFNSIGWLGWLCGTTALRPAGGMASYSVFRHEQGRGPHKLLGYDAWAARQNWWRDMREEVGLEWFFLFLPPAGSPPIPFNSAFGGLAVYLREAYLQGRYSGETCEHVTFHRKMRERGSWQMYLNPGSRYVAY